jgi:hypothetical protein
VSKLPVKPRVAYLVAVVVILAVPLGILACVGYGDGFLIAAAAVAAFAAGGSSAHTLLEEESDDETPVESALKALGAFAAIIAIAVVVANLNSTLAGVAVAFAGLLGAIAVGIIMFRVQG